MQEIAQQVLRPSRVQRAQGIDGQGLTRDLIRAVLARQLIEQSARLGEMLRAAHQRVAVGRESFPQQRQHAVAQKIARIAVIRIALVLYPVQLVRGGIGQYFLARTMQQRPDQRDRAAAIRKLGHRAHAAHPRAAQHLQQQRLRLVVGMVCHRDKIAGLTGKSRVAQLARCRLDAMLAQRCDIDTFDMQGNVQPGAQHDAEIRPGIGIRTDAVMDMQCGKLPGKTRREFMQQMQQHHRVHAAAQTGQYRAMRGKQRRDLRCHTFCEIN